MSRFRRWWRRLRGAEETNTNLPELLAMEELPGDSPEAMAPSPMALLEKNDGGMGINEDLSALTEKLVQSREISANNPDLGVFVRLLDDVLASNDADTAEQALLQLTHAQPQLAQLKLKLALLYYEQRRANAAIPLLEELAGVPEVALDAHATLADHHLREAEPQQALTHYEEVLARDYCYPRARARADELRRTLDRRKPSAAPTLLGLEDLGATGRYALQREIGRGGGGTVYLALDNKLQRPLAIKVLHAHVAREAQTRARLFCEARIAASLQHPRIVTIYDLDEASNLLAMEYCAGGTLADAISSGPHGATRALLRLAEMCSILANVHDAGVVHRDLKPANWLLRGSDADAPLVLSDFGIAHAITEDNSDAAAGSRVYMAPEQRAGVPSDARTDIYACGVVLMELLLGRPPMTPDQALVTTSVLEAHERWEELSGILHPGSAPPIIGLLKRMLAPVEQRIDSAAELAEETAELTAQSRAHERASAFRKRLTQRTDALGDDAGPWLDRIVQEYERATKSALATISPRYPPPEAAKLPGS